MNGKTTWNERGPDGNGNAAGVVLLFEGKEVRFPAKAAAAVDAITESDGSFSAAELPAPLDKPGRLVLVRRLVREGFLRSLL